MLRDNGENVNSFCRSGGGGMCADAVSSYDRGNIKMMFT